MTDQLINVLNGYAGIGGNRKNWKNVRVTAIEKNKKIAKIYKEQFPEDNVIVGDAHKYLLDNFNMFDFIWLSPPCFTNSKIFEAGFKGGKYSGSQKLKYHDLSLYQEVLLLERYYKGKYVVENVEPHYTPLIPAKKIDRHLFWSNFRIGSFVPLEPKKSHLKSEYGYLKEFYQVDMDKYFKDKKKARQILRNCVHPELGEYILDCARNIIRSKNENQLSFEL